MTDQLDDTARRLRLVPPLDDVPVITQIADMPDAYRVRRSGPAAALMARSRGNWVILFGHDPSGQHAVDGWTRQAVIAGSHGDAEAALVALALAEAYESRVTAYLDIVAATVDVGIPALLDLLRLHRPHRTPFVVACAGEPADDLPGRPAWHDCPTVRIIAASLGVELPD